MYICKTKHIYTIYTHTIYTHIVYMRIYVHIHISIYIHVYDLMSKYLKYLESYSTSDCSGVLTE